MNSFSARQPAAMLTRPIRYILMLASLPLLFVPLALNATDGSSNALQGTWTVIAGEHGGRPMDAMNGGTMKIEGDRFRIDTSAGNLLVGELILDETRAPAVMVMQHDNGLRWDAIYEVEGDDFRMNYIDTSGPDPLPEIFRTSEETEATVVVLKRAES